MSFATVRRARGFVLAAALGAALAAHAAAEPKLSPVTPETEDPTAKGFACHTGKLTMSLDENFAAVVRPPEGGEFRLPHRAKMSDAVQIAWSDGDHTLTWDVGVKLTWRGGKQAEPIACGREMHHH